jgi:hypothetical protein
MTPTHNPDLKGISYLNRTAADLAAAAPVAKRINARGELAALLSELQGSKANLPEYN